MPLRVIQANRFVRFVPVLCACVPCMAWSQQAHLFVGSSKEALAYQGPATRVLDLHGARVLPGFNDAHTHFENATQWFFEARLIDVNTESEMVERVREAAKRVPAGMWITAIDMSGKAEWARRRRTTQVSDRSSRC